MATIALRPQTPLRILSRNGDAWAHFLLPLLLAFIVGCASAPAYKSLYAVGHATDTAVKVYFDLVVRGQVKTNDVPKVARAYQEYQVIYNTALSVAQFNPNVAPDTNVTAHAAAVIATVTAAKGGSK